MTTISHRDLYALEIARILATDHYGDATRVNRAVRLYTSGLVDVKNATVQSEGGHAIYLVSTATCQCPDFQHHRKPLACKHIMALCIARKVEQLLEHQWYGSVDGEQVLITDCLGTDNVLVQSGDDPTPMKMHRHSERLAWGGHCNTVACACTDGYVCPGHYDAAMAYYYHAERVA